jgi:hypothetical protein
MHSEISKNGEKRKTFCLIVRGYPSDFAGLVEQAKAYDLYVIYTKSSSMRLIIQEVPF